MEKFISKNVKTSNEQFHELSESKNLKYITWTVENYLQAVEERNSLEVDAPHVACKIKKGDWEAYLKSIRMPEQPCRNAFHIYQKDHPSTVDSVNTSNMHDGTGGISWFLYQV